MSSTKLVDTLYFEKTEVKDNLDTKANFIRSCNDFLAGKDSTASLLNSLFEKISPYLQKRFIRMNNGYCFDRNITACWLGLCENDFSYYMNSYSNGTPLDNILPNMRTFYNNGLLDIPTKQELLALTELSEAPFEITNGRPSILGCYIFYNKNSKAQTFDTDRGYLKDHYEKGGIHPIYRLYKENCGRLEDKAVFLLWLAHKLKPIGFQDDLYDVLIRLNIELDDLKIKDIKGDFRQLKNFLLSEEASDGKELFMDMDKLVDKLKKADTLRANLVEYDEKMLFDVNKGSWEVFNLATNANFEQPIEIKLSKPLVARDPASSIVDGIIGIDFGTKSTVVVQQTESETIMPLRVGIGDWHKKAEAYHFENPTVMEFRDLKNFLAAYQAKQRRPNTRWQDVTVSHTAYDNLEKSHSDNFNAYFTELKQWAGQPQRKLKIEDYKNHVFELPAFLQLETGDFNPIELYAYYIGLYVNNQFNGVYLRYILSFPVTYEMEVRDKITESFKQGIARSLPDIGERIAELEVKAGASEPAAYAAIALQHYGLGETERLFYAIFDFGGGTTDFDFGIFRWADENQRNERRYDYVIEHFGAGGDRYLGGENLLNILAFEVFKHNSDELREEAISFMQPPECQAFAGSELLLSDSREARLNLVSVVKELRSFWERESFENEEEIFQGVITVNLYDRNGRMKPNISLQVDETELLQKLKARIEKGVKSFFEALREAFANYHQEINLDINEVHIFLAGNSSKSPLVKELFQLYMDKEKSQMQNQPEPYQGEFKLYPPIDNQGDYEQPNGKTGVAFGLIETRPGGRILVIDRNIQQQDIRFKYYLGINRRKHFKTIISRETEYQTWKPFIDAGDAYFEVYYTSSPLATTNTLPIKDNAVKIKRLKIEPIDAEADVYIRLISPTEFEYGISKDGQNFDYIKKVLL